ncbi:addiction module antitoxin RelB [Lysobacter helvus]|uniref:Addiction module antitoxin RelB n=2 Tax=Lysobacteraceae TaxID=32033 RepID=A0ABM7Q5F5_9GAMM|nr:MULTISPECIES: type II toxin-antitoxin system RelE/ParE family toxin [Lysobacter]BCT92505.1 addiction module antitoxin RelB [Lysobacter caseinilyticus]BCT95658.1 addiction module antitoxin RelB [Lysobacter helvus]
MIEVVESEEFRAWRGALPSQRVRNQIRTRLGRLAFGNPGAHRVLDGGIVELKIDIGPGYRVYYARVTQARFYVLRGGNKQTQQRDIEAARRAARELRS